MEVKIKIKINFYIINLRIALNDINITFINNTINNSHAERYGGFSIQTFICCYIFKGFGYLLSNCYIVFQSNSI